VSIIGLDIGSTTVKGCLLTNGQIAALSCDSAGAKTKNSINKILYDFQKREKIKEIITTGYGRNLIDSNRQITEITCHAHGARYLFSDARFVIDVGGQDTKAIRLGTDGRVEDFIMNDRCAAGTGRFLEVMANILNISLEELGSFSSNSLNPIKINSMCTVFAESEVISLLAKGEPIRDIINGIHGAVAEKISGQVRRLNPVEPAILTGGVSRNKNFIKALKGFLKLDIIVPENAHFTGAIGAALLGTKSSY